MRGWVIACLLALCAASGITAQAAEEIALHPETWAAFEAYREESRPGAFAVAEDGRSYGQSLCRTPCSLAAEKRAALGACRANGGGACVVFAVRDEIELAYRLLTRAEMSVCPLSPVPEIRVTLAIDETGFDRSHAVADLGRLMDEDERHWLDEHGSVMGVTEQLFDIDRTSIGFVQAKGRDGARCLRPTDGEIRLRLGARIHVASEIPDDTCLYREVLAHEHKHRALGAELAAGFATDLEAAIAAALDETPYVEVPSGARPWRVAERRLDDIVDTAHAVFARERSRQQLGIDSQSEYERVETVCPGETDRYLP